MDPNSSPSPLSALGRPSTYVNQYDPTLLEPIPRVVQRQRLGLVDGALPFFGADLWTAYELSWLNGKGKPQIAIGTFTFPCETANIIESKSLKLYLNSFNGSSFPDVDSVRVRLRDDLTEAAGRGGDRETGSIGVQLRLPESFSQLRMSELEGVDLDRLDVDCDRYQPEPDYLSADETSAPISESLCSRLLKSNCEVTGQPDWGSVRISYTGSPIDQAGLLKYIVSFRDHNEFHEPSVERIFRDVWVRCRPTKLSVYARYTRRGGIEINPYRTSAPQPLPAQARTFRQ